MHKPLQRELSCWFFLFLKMYLNTILVLQKFPKAKLVHVHFPAAKYFDVEGQGKSLVKYFPIWEKKIFANRMICYSERNLFTRPVSPLKSQSYDCQHLEYIDTNAVLPILSNCINLPHKVTFRKNIH